MRALIPPRLMLLLIVVAAMLGLFVPIVGPAPWAVRLAGTPIVAAGVALTLPSARRFDRLETNIKTFDDPGQLVTDGWFRFTRNPIYLGFVVMLTGVAVLLGSLSAWIAPLVFWLAAQFWYIPFEEQRMRATFGTDYDNYRTQVARWSDADES